MTKKIFITGGTSGIGWKLALHHLKQGYTVGICGRNQQKFLEKQFTHPQLFFFEADVANENSITDAIETFVQNDQLNMVIANAGIAMGSKRGEINLSRDQNMVMINLMGVIHTFHAAIKVMRKMKVANPHLVAIGSIAGFNGLPGTAVYSATKAAVEKYCESLALDLKKEGFKVTCICPGFIDTPLTQVNKHPMPFIMSDEKAALAISQAIEKKKARFIFPFFFGHFALFLSFLPRTWYRKIITFYQPH